jgi:soluble lytic murein transglycosylase-like protein
LNRIPLTLSIFCLLTWIYPIRVVASQQPEQPAQFINYAQFHKTYSSNNAKELPKSSSDVRQVRIRPTTKTNPTEAYSGRSYTKEEVIEFIKDYSAEYRIDSDAPLCIAKLESGFNPNSKNKNSSASGVFQYVSSTWSSTDEGRNGNSVFDAKSNIQAAIKYMSSRKNAKPWTVAKSCPPIKSIN